MSNRKPLGRLSHSPSLRARRRREFDTFALSRLNWSCARDKLAVFSSELIQVFAETYDLDPSLYEPNRLTARSPVPIQDLVPFWWHLVDEWYIHSSRGETKRRPIYGQKKLRARCRDAKIPYWSLMTVSEMKAVLARWAIAEGVPEIG